MRNEEEIRPVEEDEEDIALVKIKETVRIRNERVHPRQASKR